MRSAIGVLVFACSALLGCGESLNPLPQTAWRTAPVPSGGSIVLRVSVSNTRVTGTGSEYGLMGALEGHVTISGMWIGSTFDLALTPASGSVRPATFAGSMVSASELQGAWVQDGRSSTLVFYKE